jgi:ABC-type Co2+ transport system permease subunit
MLVLKWLTVAFEATVALFIWLKGWKGLSEDKKDQRVYFYLAAVLFAITAVLSMISLPS